MEIQYTDTSGTRNKIMKSLVVAFTLNRPVTIGGKTFKVVGIISGVAPARSAAKMNPVDALRFEQ